MIKQDTILLVDADGDCEEAVAQAAARSRYSVRWVRTSREAFKFLNEKVRDLALIIVDLDPGAHGLAILEALSACADYAGIIVLTALEESYAAPISRTHGAAACLAKPIDIEKLARTIQNVTEHQFPTCDLWGHTQPRPCHGGREASAVLRGIATKLSPTVAQQAM
jgi:DNA-binding NtrC family response regulator